tara:strand:- start:29 stop:748 length:720 start_codon:yes stop_codon:yes gene_type:complete
MVNINTVYQRVLALANKEQRGYITPQEFNLFANQAQVEIFEQYFYDLNQQTRVVGNNTFYADPDDMLEQKMQIFESIDGASDINGYIGFGVGAAKNLPSYIYRLYRVEFNQVNCEIQNTADFNNARNSGPLLAPSNSRPIANIQGNILRVMGSDNQLVLPTSIFYFRAPMAAQWGYVVVNSTAMYDDSPNKTTHFEIHASDESELVYKILKFAGVSMSKLDIVRVGQVQEQSQQQQEKQ